MLVHGLGYGQDEAAEVMGVSRGTIAASLWKPGESWRGTFLCTGGGDEMTLLRRHLSDETLAAIADDTAHSRLYGAQQTHLVSCERCTSLLEGHRRAARLMAAGWQFVPAAQLPPVPAVDSLRGRVSVGSSFGTRPSPRVATSVAWTLLLLLLLALALAGAAVIGARPRAELPEASPVAGTACTLTDAFAARVHARDGVGWPASATWPAGGSSWPEGALVGWGSTGGGAFDVFLVNPADGSRVQVTDFHRTRSSQTSELVSSPDGSAIAVGWPERSDGTQPGCEELFVVTGDGVSRPLPSNVNSQVESFGWSPSTRSG